MEMFLQAYVFFRIPNVSSVATIDFLALLLLVDTGRPFLLQGTVWRSKSTVLYSITQPYQEYQCHRSFFRRPQCASAT